MKLLKEDKDVMIKKLNNFSRISVNILNWCLDNLDIYNNQEKKLPALRKLK